MKSIGWIGTGVMGKSMCLRIISGGYKVRVYNRTREKADSLLHSGAQWCDSPSDLARGCNVVFTMVGYPEDVNEVILGEKGILLTLRKGAIIVDMTTSRPSLAEAIYKAAGDRGIESLDAPVSGGDIGAAEGTLAIMLGGNREAYEKVLPLLKLMGKNISYMGRPGAGQHTKMCNQILIASTMIGVVESLLYARKSGLGMGEVIDVIGKGAAASWAINNMGRKIVENNFTPGFYIKHFVKDMRIALEESFRMKISLPGLSLANQFYIAAMAEKMENLGTQALFKVLDRMNNF